MGMVIYERSLLWSLCSADKWAGQPWEGAFQMVTLYLAHHMESTGKPAESLRKITKAEHCQDGLAESLLESFLDGCDVCV